MYTCDVHMILSKQFLCYIVSNNNYVLSNVWQGNFDERAGRRLIIVVVHLFYERYLSRCHVGVSDSCFPSRNYSLDVFSTLRLETKKIISRDIGRKCSRRQNARQSTLKRCKFSVDFFLYSFFAPPIFSIHSRATTIGR